LFLVTSVAVVGPWLRDRRRRAFMPARRRKAAAFACGFGAWPIGPAVIDDHGSITTPAKVGMLSASNIEAARHAKHLRGRPRPETYARESRTHVKNH
jgi:hypothetical protein